ncbi:MAG: redoxin domain-containing protein [Caldiserica bacterium]|nr:redoxin domain-containing protein [Caldisericota bacterium]
MLLMLYTPAQVGAESCKMEFRKNSKVAFVCDKSYKLDVAPFVQDSTMFLPVRFFFERFGYECTWEPKTKTATFENSIDKHTFVFTGLKNVTFDFNPMSLQKNLANKDGRLFISAHDLGNVTTASGLQSGVNSASDKSIVEIDSTKIKYLWHDFTLPVMDGDGKTLTLSKVMGQADTKVVIVQIWYTGCAGCTNVLKLFQKLWTQYQGKGLKIVSINTDGPGYEEGRAEKIESSGVTYDVVLDDEYSLKPSWYDPVFPNYYLLLPGDKYIKIFQERWDDAANKVFEKTVGDLCSGN